MIKSKSINKRTVAVDKALEEMKRTLRNDIARRSILHFRVDKASILKLYKVAEQKRQPLGTMVREWVLNRLEQEQHNGAGSTKLQTLEARVNNLEKALTKKRSSTNKRIG